MEEVEGKDIKEVIKTKKSIKVNLVELLDNGVTKDNVYVESGDVIYIQSATFSAQAQYKVYVLGKVKNPGAYDYRGGLTALDACVMAGGFADYSASNRTIITRRKSDGTTEKIKVNLDKVKKGDEPDVDLQPGDRVFVPESWI